MVWIFYFNTTYVTVSHGEMYVVDNAIENFNTTYVTVSLFFFGRISKNVRDFNTTYVTVSRPLHWTVENGSMISIQLMLLLVVFSCVGRSCSGNISIQLMLLLVSFTGRQ